MPSGSTIRWTNQSVLALAGDDADPLLAIESAARVLVLQAKEKGWAGPPFNPLHLAEMLEIKTNANSDVADARLVVTDSGTTIEFNPRQPRERVRFSIAHEVAHTLFPDWREKVRNRGGDRDLADDWQLEMLCNIAASEFVLPIGSLKATEFVPSIEELMIQRRRFDVSVEAFLLRLVKVASPPLCVFFASPYTTEEGERRYRIDYAVSSPTAQQFERTGVEIPVESVVQNCTAIGYTSSAVEDWISGGAAKLECVGIPGYPGSVYPRVAGLIRFDSPRDDRKPIHVVHGDILKPQGSGKKIVFQLVNDKAYRWGGGVARKFAKLYPDAEMIFKDALMEIPQNNRLGKVVYSRADDKITIASLIAQEGYGRSQFPRIRYVALRQCLENIAIYAQDLGASIHLPKIGTGAAGGDWGIIEEMLDDTMVRSGLSVIVYEVPPKRIQQELF